MAKHETLLKAFQEGINEWVCRAHNSDRANQSAATFREIKKEVINLKKYLLTDGIKLFFVKFATLKLHIQNY